MNDINVENSRLDEIFDAFSIIAEGSYVYLCRIEDDYSRWSKKAVDYFGLPSEYMTGAGDIWAEHIHPNDRENYIRSIESIFNGSASGHDMQYHARGADGQYVVCTCRGVIMRDENGTPKYFGGIIRNHSNLSYIDVVTGVRSLYGFLDDLKGMMYSADDALILMVGITSFSNINDVYGYKFGNRTLQSFCSKLHDFFMNRGALYRMDGTRFAIISHDMTANEAMEIYNRFRSYISRSFNVDGQKISLSISGGAVHAASFDIDPETYYSCVRYAYYESKHNKLGDFVIFENVVGSDNRRKIERLNAIRNSVTDNCEGFFLCYQPIVDAVTEKVYGAETLIRWKNDKYGIVPPMEFINMLEQDALFPELGRWILKTALIAANKFREYVPTFVMNVNLSYTQLEQEGFVGDVLQLLEETGLPPENLCLEITERCRLLDVNMLAGIVTLLRQKGIKVAIDDFATGFSSLGVIRAFTVDTIKIDRSFVKDIEKSEADRITVRFISEVATGFNADVCAEGVENSNMREWLNKYNISKLQGYHYSKPIEYEQFIEYLENNI